MASDRGFLSDLQCIPLFLRKIEDKPLIHTTGSCSASSAATPPGGSHTGQGRTLPPPPHLRLHPAGSLTLATPQATQVKETHLKIQNLPHRRAEQSPLEQGGTSEASGFPVDVQVGVTDPHIAALGSGGLGSAACPPCRLVDEHKVRAQRCHRAARSLRVFPQAAVLLQGRLQGRSHLTNLSFTHRETPSHRVFLPQRGTEASTRN